MRRTSKHHFVCSFVNLLRIVSLEVLVRVTVQLRDDCGTWSGFQVGDIYIHTHV